MDPDLTVLVVTNQSNLKDFVRAKGFNDKNFLDDLNQIVYEYSEKMSVKLSPTWLINYSHLDKKVENTKTIKTQNKEEFFLDYFSKSPLWVNLEDKLESEVLKNRAKEAKGNLINHVKNEKMYIELLSEMKKYKEIFIIHGINTVSVSLLIGLTLEMNSSQLLDLATATLFSHIGYTKIPKEKFNKYMGEKNNDKDIFKLQLEAFKEMATKYVSLRRSSIAYGILEHHEYYNGKGYPQGKKGKDINLFGRIILLSQDYDEMVGGYFKEYGISPIAAINNIWDERGKKYDPDILRIFIDRTTFFKIGSKIRIKNKHQGTIIGFTDYIDNPHLPVVKFENDKILDLLKDDILF